MEKSIISVDKLENIGYSTINNDRIGLLTAMFLHCLNGCGKQWHTLYVKDSTNYRYVCDNCKATVTYVG
jgi:hypothetical protein